MDRGEYYVIVVDDNHIQLADATDSNNDPQQGTFTAVPFGTTPATGERHNLERASRALQSESPVGGLVPGEVYFVVEVDSQTIRLSNAPLAAEAALPISLLAQNSDNTTEHTFLLAREAQGVNVLANLEADTSTVASTGIGGYPSLSQVLSGSTSAAATGKEGKKWLKADKWIKKAAPVSISASVGINLQQHDVLAQVGATADINSSEDVVVKATAEEKTQVKVQGTISTGSLGDKAKGKKAAGSAAVGVGIYDNSVMAIVEDGAEIDAADNVTVSAELSYPSLIDALPFDIANAGSDDSRFQITTDTRPGDFTDELANLLNGNLGVVNILNMWAGTKARAPEAKVSVSGSVGYLDYRNDVQATVVRARRSTRTPRCRITIKT